MILPHLVFPALSNDPPYFQRRSKGSLPGGFPRRIWKRLGSSHVHSGGNNDCQFNSKLTRIAILHSKCTVYMRPLLELRTPLRFPSLINNFGGFKPARSFHTPISLLSLTHSDSLSILYLSSLSRPTFFTSHPLFSLSHPSLSLPFPFLLLPLFNHLPRSGLSLSPLPRPLFSPLPLFSLFPIHISSTPSPPSPFPVTISPFFSSCPPSLLLTWHLSFRSIQAKTNASFYNLDYFFSKLTKGTNKLHCLSLASLSRLV
jgi:hypothetical protein